MVVSFAARFMTFLGDVIIFRTITHINKICITLLVLLHSAHGDVVKLADLLIGSSWADYRYHTIAPQSIICVTPDIMKQTKCHQVDAVYTKLSAHVQSFLLPLTRGDI